MNLQSETARPGRQSLKPEIDNTTPRPLLVDGVLYFYQYRMKLFFYIVVFMTLGVLAFSYWYFSSPKTVEGIVRLSFQGIEQDQYPSGKQFSVEDFRSPGILTKALADTAISPQRVSLQDFAAHLYVTPVVPSDIQNRWKKQELAGVKKEEFSPNEFRIAIEIKGLSDREQLRLFHALIDRYQESVKYEQYAAKGFVPTVEYDYEKLAGIYDLWDIPDLFREAYKSLHMKLAEIIAESMRFHDSSYQLQFREIDKDLETWERIRLQALEALTYEGHLVKNRDIVAQRIRYRIQDLDIQIKRTSQEADEAVRLLGAIDRPQALLAGQLNNKDGLPLVDASALDKLLKSDYVGPVVKRISDLQTETQSMEMEKARLEKQLSWLPKDAGAKSGMLSAENREVTSSIHSELSTIIKNYNRLLDEYLTATITSLISVRQSPMISRTSHSPFLVLSGIALLCVFVAVLLLAIQHLFESIREQSK